MSYNALVGAFLRADGSKRASETIFRKNLDPCQLSFALINGQQSYHAMMYSQGTCLWSILHQDMRSAE